MPYKIHFNINIRKVKIENYIDLLNYEFVGRGKKFFYVEFCELFGTDFQFTPERKNEIGVYHVCAYHSFQSTNTKIKKNTYNWNNKTMKTAEINSQPQFTWAIFLGGYEMLPFIDYYQLIQLFIFLPILIYLYILHKHT